MTASQASTRWSAKPTVMTSVPSGVNCPSAPLTVPDLPSAVAIDNRFERPGECVELPDGGFVGAGGDESTVGEEDHRRGGRRVERQRLADRLLGRDVEDADRVVVGVRRGEQAAVGTERRGRADATLWDPRSSVPRWAPVAASQSTTRLADVVAMMLPSGLKRPGVPGSSVPT